MALPPTTRPPAPGLPSGRTGFQCDTYRGVIASGSNQVLAKFPECLDWAALALVDAAECCCRHPGRNDTTPHTDGSTCHTGACICVRCARSWSWDYQLRYGRPVRITPGRAAVIKAARVNQNLAWADLATATGIPQGTVSSLGYGPKDLHPFELRLLTDALRLPTARVLDIRDR